MPKYLNTVFIEKHTHNSSINFRVKIEAINVSIFIISLSIYNIVLTTEELPGKKGKRPKSFIRLVSHV